MPKKPGATRARERRSTRGRAALPRNARVPNELHTAAGGALLCSNAKLAAAAVDLEVQDAAEGNTLAGRYSRVRTQLMKLYGCSHPTAERAIAEGKVIFLERWRADLPEKRDRLALQLQAIADAHQAEQPQAAIAALREIGRLHGLYAPIKVGVTHGAEPALQLDAILGVLDSAGHAALQVVLAQIEAAKTQGRLALPPGPDGARDDIEDAELVDPGSN